MNPFYHALTSKPNYISIGESPAFSPAQTSIASLFWPQIYKSSEWLEITTTKPYFILYSTDHDTSIGGIWWGEFDSLDNNVINGFIENGKILDGDQAETPFLLKVPIAESGLTNDTIFLYYHTDTTETGNDSKQQTRLRTTTGGALHSATWTDRGRPLGIVAGETHTGYLRVWKKGISNYLGHHVYSGADVTGGKISTASNPLTFTRLQQFTASEGLPSGSKFERSTLDAFYYNSVLYGIFKYTDSIGDRFVAVAELDPATYLPSLFIKTIHKTSLRTVRTYVENDIAYILFKDGGTSPNANGYHMINYNLKDLL